MSGYEIFRDTGLSLDSQMWRPLGFCSVRIGDKIIDTGFGCVFMCFSHQVLRMSFRLVCCRGVLSIAQGALGFREECSRHSAKGHRNSCSILLFCLLTHSNIKGVSGQLSSRSIGCFGFTKESTMQKRWQFFIKNLQSLLNRFSYKHYCSVCSLCFNFYLTKILRNVPKPQRYQEFMY